MATRGLSPNRQRLGALRFVGYTKRQSRGIYLQKFLTTTWVVCPDRTRNCLLPTYRPG